MNVSIVVLPILLLFTAIIIAIPILIGIYVYRDAKSRGMDAVLWTLVALIVPSLIGLIIYLIVRKEHIVLSCPKCGGEVQESFTTCPSCGQKLKASCTTCGTTLNPAWKICPQCGKEITETAEFTPPIANKGRSSKGLLALIIAIVAIPIVIIMIAIIGCIALTSYQGSEDESTIVDTDVLVQELTDYMSPTAFQVMSAKEAELEEEYISWINEKKSDKEGMYCKVCEIIESTDHENSNNDYRDYSLTYKYMILVINPPEGKAYNFVNSNYTTIDDDIIAENLSVMLNEVDKTQGDDFGNVFVIKFVSSYDISHNDKDGGASIKGEYSYSPLTVNITTADGSFDHPIPTNQNESYIEFAQNVKSTEK